MYNGFMALDLAELRDSKGLSQAEAARRIGISAAYLSQIENGHRPGSRRVIRKLARVLGVEPWEIEEATDPDLQRLVSNWHRLSRSKRKSLADMSAALLPGPEDDSPGQPMQPDPDAKAS